MNGIAEVAIAYLRRAIKRYAESDEPDRGILCGGYKLRKIDDKYFSCAIDLLDPLRFVHNASGIEFSPAVDVFLSDLGSIPKPARKIKVLGLQLKRDSALPSFLIHDACYLTAKVNARRPFGRWRTIDITREQADVLMHDCLSADRTPDGKPITRATTFAVYQAVRRFAGPAWRAHRRRQEKSVKNNKNNKSN